MGDPGQKGFPQNVDIIYKGIYPVCCGCPCRAFYQMTFYSCPGDDGEPGAPGMRGSPGDTGPMGMSGPQGEPGRFIPGQ